MNVQHERNYFLRAKLKSEGVLTDAISAQLEVPWRTNGFISQAVFFVLTWVALAAFYGLMTVFELKHEGIPTGIAAIVLAEYLIGARRWFFTGVEAALWGAATFLLIMELPSSGRPEAMLVLAAGAAIPGWRVRNPLFGALAAIFIALYLEKRFDLGTLAALVITLLAGAALLRSWKRPTTEGLWIALMLVMPVAGWAMANSRWEKFTIGSYLIAGVILLGMAIRNRHHALFLSSMIALTICGIEISKQVSAPDEAKFTFGGALLLILAYAITRLLRDRTTGYVLTPMQLTPFDDAMEMAATNALQPRANAPEPPPTSPTGGGNFGGAGASGGY